MPSMESITSTDREAAAAGIKAPASPLPTAAPAPAAEPTPAAPAEDEEKEDDISKMGIIGLAQGASK